MKLQFKTTLSVKRFSALAAFGLLILLGHPQNTLAQWTNGTNINNTNTGNVGVGTSNPISKLHVNKTVRIDDDSGSANGSDTLGAGPSLYLGTTTGGGMFQFNGSGGVDVWQFNGAWGRTITFAKTGEVGIGTTAPASALDVRAVSAGIRTTSTTGTNRAYLGAINTGGSVLMGSESNLGQSIFNTGTLPYAGVFGTTTARPLQFVTSHTARMTIDTSGNVGVGTTSPAKKLHLFGSNTQAMFDRSANTAGNYALVNFATNGVPKFFFGMNSDSSPNVDKLSFFDLAVSATVPVMTFTGGNIGIGTVAPNPAYKLDITGATNVTGNLNATGTITGGTINAKYQDVAEWVESSQSLPAGTVVVLDHTKSNQVVASTQAYDTRVAGVISAQPGITLGESGETKVLVATTGRVRIKVDATRAPIQVGDLLVTADREGYAMKSEPMKVGHRMMHMPGTLVGKALEPLAKGTGEILVLLSLQ